MAPAYSVYGLRVRSAVPLPCAPARDAERVDVDIATAPPRYFSSAREGVGAAPEPWQFRRVSFADGSDYLRWSSALEFIVSADGRRIVGRRLGRASLATFQTYLLGHVLSFALLRQGIEPLHATVVAGGGGAIGFVGDCGAGKSTLAAAFVRAGYGLLTDDLLALREERGRFLAHPGPPRIKLFPDVAADLLPAPRGVPMNHVTPKLVIPLDPIGRAVAEATPLRALYLLEPRPRVNRSRISLQHLSPRQAFVALLSNTFNAALRDPTRLRRQLDLTARLVTAVPVTRVAFPRRLALLPAVRDAIRTEIAA